MYDHSIQRGQLLLPLFLLTAMPTDVCLAEPVHPYFIIDSYSLSETIPIKSAFEDGGEFRSGTRQWSSNWIELGVRSDHWGVGLVKRYDYDLRFSKDAAELYWLTDNKQALPIGKSYMVDVEFNGFNATGLRLSVFDSVGESFGHAIDYSIGITYLTASYMVEGTLLGEASVLSSSDYDYDAEISYHYTEDFVFDRVVDKPTGEGFAIDAEIGADLTSKLYFNVSVRDLFARLEWLESPYTVGSLDSNRKEYDENGYVTVKPLLSGFEKIKKGHVQRIDPRWHGLMSYEFVESYRAVIQYRYQYQHGLVGIGGEGVISSVGSVRASYWLENQAVELTWLRGLFNVSLSADHYDVADVRTFWLSMSYGL